MVGDKLNKYYYNNKVIKPILNLPVKFPMLVAPKNT